MERGRMGGSRDVSELTESSRFLIGSDSVTVGCMR